MTAVCGGCRSSAGRCSGSVPTARTGRSSDVVDQHVDLAGLLGQAAHPAGIHQLGSCEAGPAPLGFDGSNDLGAPPGAAAVNDNLPSVSGQAQRSRAEDAVGGPGHQRYSSSPSSRTHGIPIPVQNGLTPGSPLPPRESQQRSCRLTLPWGESPTASVTSTLPIGDFSRATHLSVKMLRHYHELGLLEPADVDLDSGYGDVGRIQESEVTGAGWYPLAEAERLVGQRIGRAVTTPPDRLTGPR